MQTRAGIEKDQEAADILAHYGKEVEPIISEVVGEGGVKMEGGYSNDGDTPLGNLIADGMRYSMKSDFAMMNGGGIRQNLEKGPITWGDLFNIQPFGNVLVKSTSRGKIQLISLKLKYLLNLDRIIAFQAFLIRTIR